MSKEPRTDVYTRVTAKIIADLEQGTRPWMKPWNAQHTAGSIQYRHVLVRMRAGDGLREIARTGVMGRDKLAELRATAERSGWLDPTCSELPTDAEIAAALAEARSHSPSTVSSVEPHRGVVLRWVTADVSGRAIHAALLREHGFTGSYSAVMRMIVQLRSQMPPARFPRIGGRYLDNAPQSGEALAQLAAQPVSCASTSTETT